MSLRSGLTGAVATVAVTAVALTVPAAAAPRAADRADHTATRQAMDAAVTAGVPGVTAGVRQGSATWGATSGVGDLRTGAPRSPQDHYRIGSITKTFVSTVMLQLEAEGRLSLDDTVEKWLPGTVRGNGNDGRQITLRNLLNHTSGIFNYTADEPFVRTHMLEGFPEHRYDTLKPEELVAVAMSHEPDFAPGTSWNYSNTNYVLAGMVVERVTGHSYAQEIRDRVIKPLGLRATSVPGTKVTVPQPSSRAYGKFAPTGPTYDVTTMNPSVASSAGEMISDSSDLNRFYSALLTGKLLPPKQLKEMKTTVPADEGTPNSGYGLGLMDLTLSCGVHLYGHSGGINGSSSVAVTTADGSHSLAFNFNSDWTGNSGAVVEAEYCGK
ncbi:serine hydrolase domain-containing protein [Streptomyces sp. NPDC052051]|uniref:serine hydrolase domain-containing protein n=1 Tax=Streptomyces sp. NPDC052051 TaxID=3154649 RepID=UPI00342F7505